MNANAMWWVGLVAAICVSVAGQTDSLPHVLKHVLSLIGIVGTAISAYMIDRPPRLRDGADPTSRARRGRSRPIDNLGRRRSAMRSGGRHEFGFELRLDGRRVDALAGVSLVR